MIWEQNNPAVNIHLKLEIKTLQNTPRDADKLERLLRIEQRQKEATHIQYTRKGWLQKRLKCSRLRCI
jgi:hypothetical protein